MSELFQAVNMARKALNDGVTDALGGAWVAACESEWKRQMLVKSSTELVRQQNSALVLASLRRHSPLAHTDISQHTGLASATVSAITMELEKAEVLERREQQASASRGRPRVIF